MRDYLAPVLAAISTPPHLPARYFEQVKGRFRNLENYFRGVYNQGKKVSEKIEGITGYSFRDPVRELPYDFRNLLEYLGTDKQNWESPFSQRIEELQQYTGFKNPDWQTVRLILKGMTRIKYTRSAYSEFFEAYSNFLKEYPDVLKELHDVYEDAVKHNQLDDYWEERLREVSDLFQTYRTKLDSVFKYIMLYFDFARQVEAYLLRKDLQAEAYYSGQAYPERRQRPPHQLIEILYHAGVDIQAILEQGFKTRTELGEGSAALGGGPEDVISFTADIRIARAITDALRDVVQIAHGAMSYEDVLQTAREEGVPLDKFENNKRDYGDDPRRLAFEAYRTLLWFSHLRYNPVFFGVRIENFERVRPENIGILAAKVNMSQVTEYLQEMEEFRAPVSAILSMKRVPY